MLRNNPQQWRPWDPVTRQDLFFAIFDEFIFSQETAIIGKERYVPPNIESRVKSAFAENSCFLGFCRSSSGWILIWCSLRLIWAQPGSRRDPPTYIYSHKFAQLSPRSNTASLFICFKKTMKCISCISQMHIRVHISIIFLVLILLSTHTQATTQNHCQVGISKIPKSSSWVLIFNFCSNQLPPSSSFYNKPITRPITGKALTSCW